MAQRKGKRPSPRTESPEDEMNSLSKMAANQSTEIEDLSLDYGFGFPLHHLQQGPVIRFPCAELRDALHDA